VLGNIEGVLATLSPALPSPRPSPKGEGEQGRGRKS
jgi:hypothetical protein